MPSFLGGGVRRKLDAYWSFSIPVLNIERKLIQRQLPVDRIQMRSARTVNRPVQLKEV